MSERKRPEEAKDLPAKDRHRHISVYCTQGDLDLVNKIVETLGVNKSEAIRTAIRAFAIPLEKVMR